MIASWEFETLTKRDDAMTPLRRNHLATVTAAGESDAMVVYESPGE